MSLQHYCADGTHTFTGRNTTPEQRALVCVNNGGEVDRDGNPINNNPVTPADILGCMDPVADNYDPTATFDDDSCSGGGKYEVDCDDGYEFIKPDECPTCDQPPCPCGSCVEKKSDIVIVSGTKTAGFGDNKMLIWLVVGGIALWYMNKEGYLKKILK